MLKGRSTLAAVAAVVLSAALLGACGDENSKELPSTDATSLRATLDEIDQRIDNQDCTGAGQQAAALREQVDALAGDVSSKLRSALAASANRLETLVANQCTAAAPETTTEEPPVGPTSQDPQQPPGEEGDQQDQPKKDKKPKKEKPNQDETQTEPGTGGSGEEVPGVGSQGDGGASPEG